ncbi:MAG: RNA-binding S4 domain-containing protein [Paracoccaceae bacterium]|nr:MAG: RNA-binding S4 domain-containing protein [Paracoccaceae bacterium]
MAAPPPGDAPRATLRIDKWLFHARFFRARGAATAMIEGGTARVNGQRIGKPAHGVAPGDVLTFPQGGRIRVVRILALGDRRGPAPEAQALYADLDSGDAEGPGPLE